MKRRVNGKQKGNSFERKVSKILSEHLVDESGKQLFRRAPDSGSYFGGSNVSRLETLDTDYATFGDIIIPRNFKFVVECKNYKTAPSFKTIVQGKIPQWDTWLKEVIHDSISSQKCPMLVVKYNYIPEIVFISKDFTEVNIEPIILYQQFAVYRLEELLSCMGRKFFFE